MVYIYLLCRKSANRLIGMLVIVNSWLNSTPNMVDNSSLYFSSKASCGGGRKAPVVGKLWIGDLYN